MVPRWLLRLDPLRTGKIGGLTGGFSAGMELSGGVLRLCYVGERFLARRADVRHPGQGRREEGLCEQHLLRLSSRLVDRSSRRRHDFFSSLTKADRNIDSSLDGGHNLAGVSGQAILDHSEAKRIWPT